MGDHVAGDDAEFEIEVASAVGPWVVLEAEGGSKCEAKSTISGDYLGTDAFGVELLKKEAFCFVKILLSAFVSERGVSVRLLHFSHSLLVVVLSDN